MQETLAAGARHLCRQAVFIHCLNLRYRGIIEMSSMKTEYGGILMCTAATYRTRDFYFGRTLDNDVSYGEEITVTPRCYRLR